MIPVSLKSFVRRLLAATGSGELQWSEGAPSAYFCNHKEYELHINYYFDVDAEQASYNFRLKKVNGNTAYFTVTDTEEDYQLMRNLYDTITVSAAGLGDIESSFFD
jgi:D-aminopeptidase